MHIMMRIVMFTFVLGYLVLFGYPSGIHAADEIPMGPAYQGPKAMISVGDFTVQARGAPQEIGDGLREMLQTALFESNYFILVDRIDPCGISAEQFLSKSFMADADAILKQGQMEPAEVMIYGAVTSLEGGGWGLRCKVPGAPIKLGGAYHKAKVIIDLRVVESASGRVIAALPVKGHALSGKGMVGTMASKCSLPMTLNLIRNTPLELAIRDCIYRAVIGLCKIIPRSMFRHRGLDILIESVE
jgi:curli biogenesis system outer membrane secretion channel CsgG